MKTFLRIVPSLRSLMVLLPLLGLLSACVTSAILPKELRMSAVELTTRMEKRFPVERSVAGLIDVSFSNPVVSLASPRLVTTLDVSAKLALSDKEVKGTLTVSGVPQYDPATRGLMLKEAKVDRIALANMSESLSGALARLASQLVRTHFDEKPFHTFKEEDFRRFGIGYEPLMLAVRDDAVVLTIRR